MNEKQGKFLFLGTGGSMGIPVIGCHCPVCRSKSSFNKRLRPSGLTSIGHKKLLIDCGPDFRAQALRHNIDDIDLLLLTHAHHDHIGGIDELRAFYLRSKKTIPCILSKHTKRDLVSRYPYIFEASNGDSKLISKIALNLLPDEPFGRIDFQNIPIEYVTFEQTGMLVNGFRFGNFAYLSDIRLYSEEIFKHLVGVETLVLSALRHDPSPCHFSIKEAIAFSERVGASHTWLTHIAHDLDHDITNARLPLNVRMAYDGLELDFNIPAKQ